MSNYKKTLAASAGFYCLLLGAPASQADFALNWGRVGDAFGGGLPAINCNRGEGGGNVCRIQSIAYDALDPDKTPFLQERVVGTDGQTYYHLVVGQPDSTFAQETFIRAGGTRWAPAFVNVVGSSSGGTISFQGFGNFTTIFNNQRPLDPDESISGNSTANPKRVEMRQVNNDGEFFQEFLKDNLSNKPRIVQTLNNADIQANFVADMRNLSLDDMNTAAPIINTVEFSDPAGNFDLSVGGQFTHVTAGQYRWIPGSGPDQSSGTWEYLEGGYNPYLEDWQAYRNPSENVTKR